jgi:transcriptional regulator with PAS, ATPase and Fis domain
MNWEDINRLHVVSKLKEIIGKWYNLDCIFLDSRGRLKTNIFQKDKSLYGSFLTSQVSSLKGKECFKIDLDNIFEQFTSTEDNLVILPSSFENVNFICSKINSKDDFLGIVVGYPFVFNNKNNDLIESLKSVLSKWGANFDEIEKAIVNIKNSDNNLEYLKDLIILLSQEISTFDKEITQREDRIKELSSELGSRFRYHTMIGKSKPMQKIYRLLEKVSSSEASVFIQGENGTGKELVARAIHYYSSRKGDLFLAVNCSAFNENLLDSELFGHEKGSFTGAIKNKKGVFEAADGGTLFLDEIGDTSLSMQVKLLRVLQEGTFLPVGGVTPRKTNVRIIAATNRNIKEMMDDGSFREDLFYRINVINISLPSLRERREDINLLLEHFFNVKCGEMGQAIKVPSQACLEKILDYQWPGNVRELENEIERLVVLSGDKKIVTPDLLSSRIMEAGKNYSNDNDLINFNGKLKDALEEVESFMIKEGLRRCNFNKTKLSKELGISRASLISKVDKYDLDKRKKPDAA